MARACSRQPAMKTEEASLAVNVILYIFRVGSWRSKLGPNGKYLNVIWQKHRDQKGPYQAFQIRGNRKMKRLEGLWRVSFVPLYKMCRPRAEIVI
jgi:hypothetical protein